ncbi:LPS translocon maturation chaperone LptM [Cronobacter dublinensis]|uniref:LPS translocon maturation chaperone LptM n=1 Tax=Cronobacter dublinensis TaxID=413497 RepID=UPI000CFCB232|nr:lipoprotein [Cronobacter dublinensis]
MKTIFRSLAVMLTLFSLTGCGLKGPLYFPPADSKAQPQKAPAPQTQSTIPDTNNRGDVDGPTQVSKQ